MDEQMFCFQCEQAAGCTACTGAAGVCGKSAETAAAQCRREDGNRAVIILQRARRIGVIGNFHHRNAERAAIQVLIDRHGAEARNHRPTHAADTRHAGQDAVDAVLQVRAVGHKQHRQRQQRNIPQP